tara:strand:+ start:3684 stop:4142 length:459 start_codon:yes stop_codon:yes gene_type:complete
MTLQWAKNPPFFEGKNNNAWFNNASYFHMLAGVILFLFINRLFPKLTNITNLILINILHVIEDYIENVSTISIEGLTSKLVNCRNDLFLSPTDHDTLQNYLGDNIAFFIGSIIGLKLDNIEFVKKNININMIILMSILYAVFLSVKCHKILF